MSVPRTLRPFAAPTRAAGDFLDVVRAEGCRLWDSEGRTYLDATASLRYCAAGHGRREIIDAFYAQMGELDAYHTFGRFTHSGRPAAGGRPARPRAHCRRPRAVH